MSGAGRTQQRPRSHLHIRSAVGLRRRNIAVVDLHVIRDVVRIARKGDEMSPQSFNRQGFIIPFVVLGGLPCEDSVTFLCLTRTWTNV